MQTIKQATAIWKAFAQEVVPIEPQINDIDLSNLVGSIYCPGPWYSFVFAINEGKFASMHQNAKLFYGKENREVELSDLIDRIHPDDHEFRHPFSRREIEIIRLISEGLSSNGIAKSLFLSPATVRTHRQNILAKAGCNKSSELIAYCFQQGIL